MNSLIEKIEINKNLKKAKFSGIAQIIEDADKLGDGIIRLEVGDVDFDPPKSISVGIQEAFEKKITHYPPLQGYKALIKEILNKLCEHENILVEEQQVLICSGGSMGIFLTMQALLNAGDEVLIFEPIWPHLIEMLVVTGANPIKIPLKKEDGFHIDIKEVENKITANTKAIVINTPNNPTGVVYSKSEIKELASVCQKHGIIIISDEEYCSFTYSSNKHISPLKYYDATIVCRSFSKSLSISGLRLGYIIGPKNWITSIKKLQLFTTMYSNSLVQYAVTKELTENTSFISNMTSEFENRMKIIVDGLKDSLFVCNNSEGSVYVWIDCSNYNNDDEFVAKQLLYECGIAVVPGSCFGEHGKGFLRVSLGSKTENIKEAVDRMNKFLLDKEI